MSKLKEILEADRQSKNWQRDKVIEQISGYFEDIAFGLESIEETPMLSLNTKKKLRRTRQDILKLRAEIEKELG